MKVYLITHIVLSTLALFATLTLFFTGRSNAPRKDAASSLFNIAWIAWTVYLLVGLR